jgi:hypothetical protein
MYCGNCGTKVGEKVSFCSTCGKNLVKETQNDLYSFGPFGTGICFSRPGFLSLIQKNNTKIVVTNNGISGYSTFRNSVRFEIAYSSIVATEIFDYLLWKVLWIKYRDGQKSSEVSIMCTAAYHQQIVVANNLVNSHLPS